MARIVTCTRPRIGNGRDGRAYFEAPPSGIVGYPCGAIVLCGAAIFPIDIHDSAAGQDPLCPWLCVSRILDHVEASLRLVHGVSNLIVKKIIHLTTLCHR